MPVILLTRLTSDNVQKTLARLSLQNFPKHTTQILNGQRCDLNDIDKTACVKFSHNKSTRPPTLSFVDTRPCNCEENRSAVLYRCLDHNRNPCFVSLTTCKKDSELTQTDTAKLNEIRMLHAIIYKSKKGNKTHTLTSITHHAQKKTEN